MTANKRPAGGNGGLDCKNTKHAHDTVTDHASAQHVEREALNRLHDAVVAIGLSPGHAVGLFAACDSYARARAYRLKIDEVPS